MKTKTYRVVAAATIALSLASLSCNQQSSSVADPTTNTPNYRADGSRSEVVTLDNPSSPWTNGPSTNGLSIATSSSGSDSLTRDNSFRSTSAPTNSTSGSRSDALTPDNSYRSTTTNPPPATNQPPAATP